MGHILKPINFVLVACHGKMYLRQKKCENHWRKKLDTTNTHPMTGMNGYSDQIKLYDNGMVINDDSFRLFRNMPNNAVSLVLTDIPYGVVNRKNGLRVYDKGIADVVDFDMDDLLDELTRVCSGTIYVFCSTEQVSEIRGGFVKRGLSTRLGIWEKTNPPPVHGQRMWLSGVETCVFARKSKAFFAEHCKNSVWRYPCGRSKRHPTEKPLRLFEYLMTVSSRPGDWVFDPFCGSGTTAEAAMIHGRKFLCVEKDRNYFDVINKRLEKYTAKTGKTIIVND